jgi:DNA invertase Pin-like site-specific DNA recombinase
VSTRKGGQVFRRNGHKTGQQSKSERLPAIRKIGYARVSTAEQNLQMQIDALLREGVHPDNLHVEKVSGVSARRPKLDLALMDARAGDTFYVWKLDRLGRNVVDLYGKVELLAKNGVGFRSIMDQFDTSTAMGKAMFGMMAVFAQFERDQTIERTKRGLQAARERGFKPGAKRTVDVGKARKMLRKKTVREVADHFGVTPNAVRRYFTLAELNALRNEKA